MVKPRTLDLSSIRDKPALTWLSEGILDVLNLDAMKGWDKRSRRMCPVTVGTRNVVAPSKIKLHKPFRT